MEHLVQIDDYIRTLTETLEKIDKNKLLYLLDILEKAAAAHKIIYIFGNGGSCSTASHIQNDFNCFSRKKFKFCCLADNIATLTAIANDISYDEIYKYQLEKRLEKGDIVIALSGSGNSCNVIKAVEYAKSCGNTVIGFCGFDGGKLKQLADVSIHVPVANMRIAEDIHLILNHILISVLNEKDRTGYV